MKPNILFIMPDQLRADFLSCYGVSFIDTPHIDSLASDGVRYERAISAYPICVPTRAALLTGMNAMRNGVTDNGQWLRPDLHDCGIDTWPEILAQSGYHTAAVGKMHFYPWDITHGFQYRVAAEDKRWIHVRDDYYHFLRARGERKYHGNEHTGYYENKGAIINRLPLELTTDRYTGQEACRFIREAGNDGPFAMMVGFPGPHCPYDPTPEYMDQFDPADMPDSVPEVPGNIPKVRQENIDGNLRDWNGVDHTDFNEAHKKKVRAHYAALVKQIDDEVGSILAVLEETGLRENTIIIFTSDHGDYLGDHNMIGKGTFFESSIHVPLIVQQPGKAAAVVDAPVMLTDVTATMLALAGCERPTYLDSRPLPGLGIDDATPREQIIGMTSGGWMIDDGRWKLHKYATGENLLFDRGVDPTEQRNLYADAAHQETLHRLDSLLTQEMMRSTTLSHEEKRVYGTVSLSNDPAFGHRGWARRYPQGVD